nr:MAG TPA: hypothetical protein [Caudoviricetes sp.]
MAYYHLLLQSLVYYLVNKQIKKNLYTSCLQNKFTIK